MEGTMLTRDRLNGSGPEVGGWKYIFAQESKNIAP